MSFSGKHLLSVDGLHREQVEKIFTVADKMHPYATRQKITRVLEGAILGNMFFEASTRTRLSFGAAFNSLGGQVREINNIKESSINKGESLYDTARVISGYSDIIVMRHPEVGAVAEFAAASRVPVINAGDGDNEHPSQALLDLYTIQKECQAQGKTIDGLRIALIGDLKHGRAVHSLCRLLKQFSNITFHFVSPESLALPSSIQEELLEANQTIHTTEVLETGIQNADIVYMTRIQEERFENIEEANQYKGLLRLNQSIYTKHCEPNTVIMHPLPRDSRSVKNSELDNDLNQHKNLAIFRQANNGLVVRMALFVLTLDVLNEVEKHTKPVCWFTTKGG